MATPLPRISWLKVGSATWLMGITVPETGARITFFCSSWPPPNIFFKAPNTEIASFY
jgi:hypothetical protein